MVTVEYGGHVLERGLCVIDLSHRGFHLVAHINDVGVGCTENLESDSLISVQAVIFFFRGIIVGHPGHVGDGQSHVVDGKVFNFFQDLQFSRNTCHIAHRAFFHIPGRDVDVVVPDSVDQVVYADGRGIKNFWFEVNGEHFVPDSSDIHVGHTLDPFQLLGDVIFRPIIQVVQVSGQRHTEIDNGPVVHPEPPDADVFDVVRQLIAHLVDPVPDLHRGQVHVGPPFKLHVDIAGRCRGGRTETF